jgi:hypothetical protein
MRAEIRLPIVAGVIHDNDAGVPAIGGFEVAEFAFVVGSRGRGDDAFVKNKIGVKQTEGAADAAV